MRGDEERVFQAFCAFLTSEGWSVSREVSFADVVAEKDGRQILAEAKGRTAAIGLDVDTMYGQLLRRMPDSRPDAATRFTVVVPTEEAAAVRCVPAWILKELAVDIYLVGPDGSVAAPDK